MQPAEKREIIEIITGKIVIGKDEITITFPTRHLVKIWQIGGGRGGLYQQEKLDADGFSQFYTPLVERQKQIEAELPRLEAEVDILKVNTLSAEEIALQASNLYDHWQTMQPAEKREIIEIITDKIIVGKDEITINLSYSQSCKDMAKGERKGWDSNPR
ncbi:MAG TPA: hypothetical protein VFC85_02340 [Verrucomicrobiae bacterium]|nr:hypothetical protein [Verrucomicrobiae bacterium]